MFADDTVEPGKRLQPPTRFAFRIGGAAYGNAISDALIDDLRDHEAPSAVTPAWVVYAAIRRARLQAAESAPDCGARHAALRRCRIRARLQRCQLSLPASSRAHRAGDSFLIRSQEVASI